jgi:Tat protein translocase TatB subunit
MFGVGPEELVLILIIALIVLGPERMPKVARDLGRVVGELRRTSDQLREEFLNADKLLDKAAEAAGPTTPAPSIPAIPATTQTSEALPVIPGETNFDREMREARERLKAQRDA